MDIQEQWDQARKRTEVIRMRLQDLATFDATAMPYIFLAESSLHQGDTVVRRGQVMIQRPAIVLPNLSPQFEGFEFEATLATFLLVRGVQFPSLKYRHELSSLDVMEQSLDRSIEQFKQRLTMAEDITTGLVVGPEASWQFSVLLMVGALVIRSAQGDVRRILEDWSRRQQRG